MIAADNPVGLPVVSQLTRPNHLLTFLFRRLRLEDEAQAGARDGQGQRKNKTIQEEEEGREGRIAGERK